MFGAWVDEMLNFESVLNNDRLMKSLTGLSREEFEVLLPTFEQVWKESLESKERQRLNLTQQMLYT
ncbi:hypothetical protein FACS1894122_06640 [Alphaproteobacteria bacterium]|nr:hypothetical protein FACS1894122_06640 [Alphaproteobacteria bacterium]